MDQTAKQVKPDTEVITRLQTDLDDYLVGIKTAQDIITHTKRILAFMSADTVTQLSIDLKDLGGSVRTLLDSLSIIGSYLK